MALREPQRVSGGSAGPDGTGHLEELRTDPIGLMRRVRAECGDLGAFDLAGRPVILLSGAEANEFFFRAPDEDLDQAQAYPFMTPIFGRGVVFDASPERRREALHNQALRGDMMRGHAQTIAAEVGRMTAAWGPAGEIDLLDWFAELTIYTSSACLIGTKFRGQLDGRFARLYHDLERGTDALAFVDPYAPIESFRRRDQARQGLVTLVQQIMDGRQQQALCDRQAPRGDRDLLDVLMSITEPDGSPRFSADEITGMFISMMFAGHHTSSGTAAWTLIELLRHPDVMAGVVVELDDLYAGGAEISFQALREIPLLESAIKESLRLHPPLILLLRVATRDLEVLGYRIPAGALVGASPAISNRSPEDFPGPDDFRPQRYAEPRQEDLVNRWTWIPFGAGRHRCVGANFAMIQLKAIFSALLRAFDFELAQPPGTYRNDHSKMVVQLAQPCVVRYEARRRAARGRQAGLPTGTGDGHADRG
ncbi:MAG: cytochrome P450 [Micromonosporaceae bacterium]